MKSNLLEEIYECIDAIEANDTNNIKEEIGDVFLNLLMISYMHQENDLFTIDDVFNTVADKLVRRHPHVFAGLKVKDSEEILLNWKKIKSEDEGRKEKKTFLSSLPKNIPPLEKAFQIQKAVSKVGFDWSNVKDVWNKIHEEIDELEEAFNQLSFEETESELGDLLFSIINISRYYKIDPAIALNKTNKKFINRFEYVENELRNTNKELNTKNNDLMNVLWEQAKSIEE